MKLLLDENLIRLLTEKAATLKAMLADEGLGCIEIE